MKIESSSSIQRQSNSLAQEIEIGLLASNPVISPKFLYDELGSYLFTAITRLPEYYPTDSEREIFTAHHDDIVRTIGIGGALIDLGAGDCQKAQSFFKTLRPSQYVAVDFSITFLEGVIEKLKGEYQQIDMYCLGMDFTEELVIPDWVDQKHRTFFYPGSSIGNFSQSESILFLKRVKSQIQSGGLLLGVDLMKDESVLEAAYDDPLGVTAAFNLNILNSVNAHIESDFDISQFKHKIKVNQERKRVELYLEPTQDTTVSWPGNTRTFRSGELIHTENSHKYTIESIFELLESANFAVQKVWTDPKKYFAVVYAQ